MKSTDDLAVLEFDLPEFKLEDISVKVNDNKININAKKRGE